MIPQRRQRESEAGIATTRGHRRRQTSSLPTDAAFPSAREAIRTLLSRSGLVVAEVAVLAFLVAIPVLLEHDAASSAIDERSEDLARGTGILVVSAGSQGTLGVEDCLTIARADSIEHIGWFRPLGAAQLEPLRSLALRHVGLGGDAPNLLGLDGWNDLGQPESIVVGSLVADEFGLPPGASIPFAFGTRANPATVSTVLKGPRAVALDFTVMTSDSSDSGPVQSCWADFGRPTRAGDTELIRGLIGPTVAENVSPLAGSMGSLVGGYRARPSRFMWVGSVFLGVAVYWLLDWFRRSETALYRAVGVRRLHLLAVRAWERLIVGAGAFGIATACSLILIGSHARHDLMPLIWAEASAVSLGVLALSIVTTRTLSSKRLAELLKDR